MSELGWKHIYAHEDNLHCFIIGHRSQIFLWIVNTANQLSSRLKALSFLSANAMLVTFFSVSPSLPLTSGSSWTVSVSRIDPASSATWLMTPSRARWPIYISWHFSNRSCIICKLVRWPSSSSCIKVTLIHLSIIFLKNRKKVNSNGYAKISMSNFYLYLVMKIIT